MYLIYTAMLIFAVQHRGSVIDIFFFIFFSVMIYQDIDYCSLHFTVVLAQLLSHIQLYVIPWTTALQAPLSSTVSWGLLKFMFTESMMLSNHLILCHPLLVLPSLFPSIKVLANQSALCIRWQKCWSFSFSNSPSNEYSGLISFRIDWFDLVVQGTLESFLAPPSKSINSVVLSLLYGLMLTLYMTTRKPIALTTWTFVGKVMSPLINTLSRFVIAFLPRSKCLLISWLQSSVSVILEPKERKSVICFYFFHFYFPWSDGTRCHDLNAEFQASIFTLLFHPYQDTL